MQVMEEIVQRTASAMADRGTPFSGILFAGLMIKNGKVCRPLASKSHSWWTVVATARCAFPHSLRKSM